MTLIKNMKPVIQFILCCGLLISCDKNIKCVDLKKDFFSVASQIKNHEDTLRFLKKLDDIIERQPRCIKALQLRGGIYYQQQKFLMSKENFLKAYKIDSSEVYTAFHLGVLYNFEGTNDSSLYFLNIAKKIKEHRDYIIDLNNDFSETLDVAYNDINHFRGIVYFELQDYTKSKNDFLFCLQNGYYGYDTFGYLSSIYLREKNTDSACYYYKKALHGGVNNILDKSLITDCQ